MGNSEALDCLLHGNIVKNNLFHRLKVKYHGKGFKNDKYLHLYILGEGTMGKGSLGNGTFQNGSGELGHFYYMGNEVFYALGGGTLYSLGNGKFYYGLVWTRLDWTGLDTGPARLRYETK